MYLKKQVLRQCSKAQQLIKQFKTLSQTSSWRGWYWVCLCWFNTSVPLHLQVPASSRQAVTSTINSIGIALAVAFLVPQVSCMSSLFLVLHINHIILFRPVLLCAKMRILCLTGGWCMQTGLMCCTQYGKRGWGTFRWAIGNKKAFEANPGSIFKVGTPPCMLRPTYAHLKVSCRSSITRPPGDASRVLCKSQVYLSLPEK